MQQTVLQKLLKSYTMYPFNSVEIVSLKYLVA